MSSWETDQRLAWETAQKNVMKEAAEAARRREEELRPDREKLLAVASMVEAIEVPAVSESAKWQANRVNSELLRAAETIRRIVSEMD